jgi:NAD(P)-dependent dehydrogenase (short-subunit alcohol dehydrogenase family)
MGLGLHERFGKLDIVVGNAGVLPHLAPTGHLDPSIWQEIIDVNLTANWRLIRSLDPLLRRSDSGRAVFTTCAAGRQADAHWNAYAAAKAGLEALVRSYAAEVSNTPIRANLVDPGPVHTKLRNNAFPGEDKTHLRKPEDVTDVFLAAVAPDCARNGEIFTL